MDIYRDLTDTDWQNVAALLPELRPRTEPRGRPLTNTRAVVNGVLWVLFHGETWASLPSHYPPYQTCHRRFKAWREAGVLEQILTLLYGEKGSVLWGRVKQRRRVHGANPQRREATWIVPITPLHTTWRT